LTITTTSVPSPANVGSPVSATFAASGGVPPYTWSATGLPAGLSVSAAGALSGSPTAAGTTTFSVTVTDSRGATSSRQFTFQATLPTVPPLVVTGLPATGTPTSQPRLAVGLGTPYPVDVAVDLTMTFAPDTGPDDPTVQFSGGGRTARIMVPAGSTTGVNDVGVQVGTVAGTITITARLTAAGQDVTPTPVPTRTIRINSGPPVITSVTATRTASGFTVVITGYAPSREVTTANFQFTPASGADLQTTQVSVPVGSIFGPYFQSAAGASMGSQFAFTQPFTVQGTAQIVSVSVTLAGQAGTSNAVSANLQ
jgi:hypothetical protein